MYTLNFRFVQTYASDFLLGAEYSILLVVGSFLIALFLGILLAICRQSKRRGLKLFSAAWVNLLRNTPFLVQLFFFYYGLPVLGISTSPLITGIIGLGINSSAANCEAIRAGLMAVKASYYECSEALGFSRFQTFRYVVLPVALRVAFKPLTNNVINLVLGSSVCLAITLPEFMSTAKTVASRTNRPFEVYIVVMFCYCIATYLISFSSKVIDKKISVQL